ncbi:mismatch-specific DNA-glycosylase [Kineosporia sp. NBRC 101677]|uniref:mismatch-specific DNA-glycosylase n=1 Tax=Kineosporia sp. NBRC 101677 TaxID=3032197 RepID=UPI00249FF2EC|nr:mismatch-specific DNA-glycosylase [Kineosporia sp. NBRC 101677]GLY13906.1 mismatch-specific DNA-glycosylase [Kineosporia sp. NBRC 101677]
MADPGRARFTREQLQAFRDARVPDLLAPDLKLLFVGINPGLWTAAVQAHFARRGNRFYPALYRSGLTDRLIDASSGYTPEDLQHLYDRGLGISNLAHRATARADELTPDELLEGAVQLRALVARKRPQVVAFLGITAYRTAFALPKAKVGRQPEPMHEAQVWVLPNPSGLNANVQLPQLAEAFREVGRAAGVIAA